MLYEFAISVALTTGFNGLLFTFFAVPGLLGALAGMIADRKMIEQYTQARG